MNSTIKEQFLKVFNLFTIIGILGSGGDTKYALVLDLSSVWI